MIETPWITQTAAQHVAAIRLTIPREEIRRAVGQYVAEVRSGQFPTHENSFHVPELEELG